MKLALKPLAACLATVFAVTSFNAWGETPPPPVQPEAQTGTATQPGAAPPAATPPQVTATQSVVPVLPTQPKEFPGIAWGSFLAFPELALAATYDDNIYAEPSNEREDTIYTLSPSLTLKSNWKQHQLNLEAGGDFDRYRKFDSEDVNDYWLGFDGHYDLSARSSVFGGARHSRDHEDRSAAGALDPTAQLEPTLYDHEEAHLGLTHAFRAFRLRAGGTFDQYDFKDGVSGDGATVDNDYRDHDLISLGARLGYVLSPRYEFFGQYSTDMREYDNLIPGQNFNRDSDGYRAAAGLKFTLLPRRLAGEVFAGVMSQEFDDPNFSDVSKPYYSAVVVWKPTSLLTATGFIDRTLEETTVFEDADYASSSLDTTYGFEVERRLTSRLSVSGDAAYTRSDFQSFDRLDKIIDAGAGLRYYMMPKMYVGADLRFTDRDSDDPFAEYRRYQGMITLGYTPARNPDYAIPPAR